MNKYHFLRVIDRLLQQRKPSHWEHAAIPFSLAVGCLLALLPGDFKYYWGFSAKQWETLAVILLGLSGIATVVLFVKWIIYVCHHAPLTPEAVWDQVLDEMRKDTERVCRGN